MAVAHLMHDETFEVGNTGLRGTQKYAVLGALNADQAYLAVGAIAPAGYFGIPTGSVQGQHLGGNFWHVTVNYDPRARSDAPASAGAPPPGATESPGGESPAQPMGREFSLSTGGGTKHIIRSRRTVSTTLSAALELDPDAPRPDFRRLIGFSKDGVEGVDIIAPDPQIRIVKKLSQMTLGYFLLLCRMTGTTNDSHWGGFGECELLFVGADATWQGDPASPWNLTIALRFSRTELGVDCGGSVIVPVKLGWHYLWCAYTTAVGEVDNRLISVPYAAMVEEVYEPSNFNDLAL